MAIVIKSNPGSYYSAQEDLIFVVYEATKANDPVTYPDYKYVADVYVGATQVARIKRVPLPDNKMGVFNIGNIVRNYVAALFNPTGLAFQAQQMGSGQFFTDVTVKFGEEYNFTLYTNLTVDSERRYFNHYNGRMPGQRTILPGYTDKVLSTRPYATPVYQNDAFCFLPYLPTSGSAVDLLIKGYDAAGNNLSTITTTFTPSAAGVLQLLNVAPAVLLNNTGTFLNGVAYYTVKVNNSEYRFSLVCEPRYTNYTLHFLNKFGGFESRDFTKVSRKNIAITKTDYGRLPYTIDASGNVNYYNSNKVYNETKATYSSQFSEKLVLNSDILTDSEYQWLGELILSPLVYIEMDGYFIPCTITSNDYEFKKAINDKLTNLTLNIEFGDSFNAQYR